MIESWYRWWVIWRTCVMWTCIRVLWAQVLRIRCRVCHRRQHGQGDMPLRHALLWRHRDVRRVDGCGVRKWQRDVRQCMSTARGRSGTCISCTRSLVSRPVYVTCVSVRLSVCLSMSECQLRAVSCRQRRRIRVRWRGTCGAYRFATYLLTYLLTWVPFTLMVSRKRSRRAHKSQ